MQPHDSFAALRTSASRYAAALVLDDVPDLELLEWGNAGKVVLISRCESRLAALVRKASIGAAERADLEQAAILGFLRALDRFDMERGVHPFSFAHSYILEELRHANRNSAARPGEDNESKRFWAAMAAMDNDPVKAREWSRLQRLTGFALQDAADAGNTLAGDILDERISRYERKGVDVLEGMALSGRGLTPDVFTEIYQSLHYVSMDAPLSTADDTAGTLHDVVQDDAASAAVASVEDRATVAALLSTLPERDAEIMRALFGVDGPERTATELSEEYDVSAVRIRGIRASALKKLSKISA
ncbi:sigma-70 family RNA polymerase sigma factor [Nocardiopsis alba]|uniref:sigma-70 family RNA polymerase sigma factor n=1 Tax=Nocardiopsis alba TaxID=53437 RepID=UPI003D739825